MICPVNGGHALLYLFCVCRLPVMKGTRSALFRIPHYWIRTLFVIFPVLCINGVFYMVFLFSLSAAVTSDPSVLNKYQSGFAECAGEVSRYLASVDTNDAELKARLLNHLANTLQRPNVSPIPVTSSVGPPLTAHVRPTIQHTVVTTSDQGSPINLSTKLTAVVPEINNNSIPLSQGFMPTATSPPTQPCQTTAKLVSGVQLIPSRLPSGEMAFVIPGNVLTTSQMSNYVIPLYAGPPAPQVSNPVCSSPPVVVSPPAQSVPVSLAQTPIMILPSPALSPMPNVNTSPDSSTNTIGVEPHRETAASPTLRDSTNKNIQFQQNRELDMKMIMEPSKPAQPEVQVQQLDENMWRPW